MNAERSLRFKIASEESEFDLIFRLNYKTFVEEIPQHPPNPEKRLVELLGSLPKAESWPGRQEVERANQPHSS